MDVGADAPGGAKIAGGHVPMEVGEPGVGTGASGVAVPIGVGPGPEAMETD